MITAGLGGLAPASLGETPKKGGPGGGPSPPRKEQLCSSLFQETIVFTILTHNRPETPNHSTGF